MGIASFVADEMLSATELSKKTGSVLTDLTEHMHRRFVIMRNNRPNAVLLSMDEYEHLLEQVEDAELSQVAEKRLANYDQKSAISHEDMQRRFK
ncbi:MAG: type II toxin-antitoxin system Phd/YefM family antitoxin [Mariprofundaceae bacterium]|nr:type II toxin-antitoxin system Phd/YefM family antitoxin [Mariprofundaceae bacterium]